MILDRHHPPFELNLCNDNLQQADDGGAGDNYDDADDDDGDDDDGNDDDGAMVDNEYLTPSH